MQQSSGLTLRTAPTQDSDLTVTLGRSLDRRKGFGGSDPAQDYIFNSERRIFSVQDDLYLTQQDTVSLGFDFHDDSVDSTTSYSTASRYSSAIFAQYQKTVGKHNFLARIRPLHDEQFGSHTTGNIAWGYHFSNALSISASYGTAYKAPTFNDLYYPGYSNPNLQPETSDSSEAGLNGVLAQVDWDLRVYHTRIDNLIVYDSTFTPANLGKARINGIEAGVSGSCMGWTSRITATWLTTEDGQTGNRLIRRPDRSLRMDSDRQFGRVGMGLTLIAQSDHADVDSNGNHTSVAGYGLLNLRASWQLHRRLLLQGRIDNALDQRYQLVDTYNTAGRSLFVSLHYDSGA